MSWTNLLPGVETAFLSYFKTFCDTEGLNWYRTMNWLEAQPDDQGNLVGITAPFVSVTCGDMAPASPDSNLDDADQVEKSMLTVLIRTLAKDIYSDATEKQLVMTGLDYHMNLVGSIKDRIYFPRDTVTQVRTKLEVVINSFKTSGVEIAKVSRPSQSKPKAEGSTYATIITIPFQAEPKDWNA
jgi:hypothetical protein